MKNGDRWIVNALHNDGSLNARGAGGGGVRLPADYVAANVAPTSIPARTGGTAHEVAAAA